MLGKHKAAQEAARQGKREGKLARVAPEGSRLAPAALKNEKGAADYGRASLGIMPRRVRECA
jgi:hypothetical protein